MKPFLWLINMDRDLALRLFEYKDGKLINRVNRGTLAIAGEETGSYVKGYLRTKHNKKQYLNHRLIFLMHYGYLPKFIDHINGIKDDNRIENLREATPSQNRCNARKPSHNKSGVKGLYWRERQKKWVAIITCNYVKKQIGSFESIESAKAALSEARKRLHGDFFNIG